MIEHDKVAVDGATNVHTLDVDGMIVVGKMMLRMLEASNGDLWLIVIV